LTDDMPSNPLTEILKDFRRYRPDHHTAWLEHVYNTARSVGVKKFALEDNLSALLHIANLD